MFAFLRPSAAPPSLLRYIYLTNILSFIFFFLATALIGVLLLYFGWEISIPYIILVCIIYVLVIILNNSGFHQLGRLLFCLVPSWMSMIITILLKLHEQQSFVVYLDSRIILLATAVLPAVVFTSEERLPLIISLGSTFLFLAFFDPIHELLGIGFYQVGYTVRSYSYLNYIVIVSFLIITFGVFLLRRVMEKAERALQKQNKILQATQNEIESQHEELLQQQEELMSSSEKLEAANALILKQQAELEKYNAHLEALVEEKGQELIRTNKELVRHNHDLVQFSYTVSHNLRGPVARLLGLSRLFMIAADDAEKYKMQELILRSSEELDEILSDLSLIIDIRNELYNLRHKVFFEDEWKRAVSMLGENIKPEYVLKADFSNAPSMEGIKPMIQSIFYNLLSNAIKYQSPERLLEVTMVSNQRAGNKIEIRISDNGLGIDMNSHREQLFKLYRRFHTHVGGKGLGLYLVKAQVEAMGGSIEVYSRVGEGTVFTITFEPLKNERIPSK